MYTTKYIMIYKLQVLPVLCTTVKYYDELFRTVQIGNFIRKNVLLIMHKI